MDGRSEKRGAAPDSLRVFAWVPEVRDSSPGQRYRIEQWEPWLLREGITLDYAPFSTPELAALLKCSGRTLSKAVGVVRALARRISDSRRASAYDLVYVFREGSLLGPALAERLLGPSGPPVVYDFDDAVWMNYVSPANGYFAYLRSPGKTAKLCRIARHVIVGNAYLQRYAARHNPTVTIVPSTIDTGRYPYRGVRRTPDRPVLGWTGSYSTGRYLELVKGALLQLRSRYDFRFVVIGPVRFELSGVDIEHRAWSPASEVASLLDLDVGLMPVPDEEWERGKCGLKALQYMALGIPPVVSPVGANTAIVAHGHNGFLASSTDEWCEYLGRLIGDADLRGRIGQEARHTVTNDYSAEIHGPRVARIFRETAIPSRT